MKFKSTVLSLVLMASLPGSGLAMQGNPSSASPRATSGQAGRTEERPAQPDVNATPNIIGMFSGAIDFMKRNEAVSWFAGGLAAFAAYKIFTRTSGKKPVRKKNVRSQQSATARPQLQEGIAFLVEHAQEAVQLFQQGKMPKAYLHGKYCEIAQQVGFDRLPEVERVALANAVLGFDLAFTGYDYAAKKKVGIEAALRAAGERLQNVLQQLVATYGSKRQSHENEPQARSANPAPSIFQALINQVKANPIQTVSLIVSSGYALLAQIYGWPPYGPPVPTPAPASQPNHVPGA